MEDTDVDVGHGAVVEALQEPGDGLSDGVLEVIDELVRVLIEELVNSLGKSGSLSTEQVFHLYLETSQSDGYGGFVLDDQSLNSIDVPDGELGHTLHGGVGELGGVGGRSFGLQLEDGHLTFYDVLPDGSGGWQEHFHGNGLGSLVSVDVDQLMFGEACG